jgi:hypothetical protein
LQGQREREGALARVSNKRGTPFIEGGFVLVEERRFWEFQVLGFRYRCYSIILGGLRRSFGGGFISIESGTISQEEGAPHLGG